MPRPNTRTAMNGSAPPGRSVRISQRPSSSVPARAKPRNPSPAGGAARPPSTDPAGRVGLPRLEDRVGHGLAGAVKDVAPYDEPVPRRDRPVVPRQADGEVRADRLRRGSHASSSNGVAPRTMSKS